MTPLRFGRDPWRERVGRTAWPRRSAVWRASGHLRITLLDYFRPDTDAPLNPSWPLRSGVYISLTQSLYGDAVRRRPTDDAWREAVRVRGPVPELIRWTGPGDPDWVELDYSLQCETADVLPSLVEGAVIACGPEAAARAHGLLAQGEEGEAVLLDLLKELGLWDGLADTLGSAARVVAHRSWHSAYYEQHVSSIEGDYELFDAFEAQWLEAQEALPRRWTRMGLAILAHACTRISEWGLVSTGKLRPGTSRRAARSGQAVPEPPPLDARDVRLAEAFLARLTVEPGDRTPTLADFFR